MCQSAKVGHRILWQWLSNGMAPGRHWAKLPLSLRMRARDLLLVAGGIGINPLLSMIRAYANQGKHW